METKLKATRAGNRAAVTKLWTKFEELKENPDDVEMEKFKAIEDAVNQKKKILHDLNEKMIEVLHEDHIEQEIANSEVLRLTPIQKLKAQLEGSAAETVEGFALTNGNYESAVNLLRDRFRQPSKLIHAYMKALMNLPATS
ncbi:Hypothetical predicted protein [Mytilus galloprovincialis]|uniref:Uncharacterized protein n=1 Tax=Mytilus galloprovincialis TaxID=29158 RepID=A0A8B6FAJ2_MYTGA|nr:Hypothetical predicted protein [Mytilus galloprovincialis]